ncbi:MAG: penicillin-binding protein 2 [Chthoniobacterales bacterium]
MRRYVAFIFFLCSLSPVLSAATAVDNTGVVENPKPTWETQKQARTFQLRIPAPRGQITDRNGHPLAQTRLSYNLAISFPTPLDWTDQQIINFVRQQATLASGLLKREIKLNEAEVIRHYKNRAVLPLDIIEDLSPPELAIVQKGLTPNLILRQTYLRHYPENKLAAHIIGYVGREAPLSTRPIENKDLIFPESEGREGLEQTFDDQLRGRLGVLNVTFDPEGRKIAERIASQPVPGNNLVTTIDKNLQAICEDVLKENTKRGAIVVIEVATGEVLALASWPTFDPNLFVPSISAEVFAQLRDNPDVPLYPRAFRSAYPPGSTFKTIVGLAALETGKVTPRSHFNCPPSISVGNVVFRNWKKEGAGSLNFVQAMQQSCNTWFYQVGLKIGSDPIIEWSKALGLGNRTGIPLAAEERGNIPTDDYMLRVHNRKILQGDVANMSIGQGDILVTPLQMAQAMGVIAADGKFHQTRLVKQIQAIDNSVVAAYPDRLRADLPIQPGIYDELCEALVAVTKNGTGRKARVKGIEVAGKTGTAQWGPKVKQKTAAWFAGFLPADNPRYAFAAVYESDPGAKAGGGSHAAPLIGKTFKKFFAKEKNKKVSEDSNEADSSDEDAVDNSG